MASLPISYTEWKMFAKGLASLHIHVTLKIRADNPNVTWLALSIKIKYWLPSSFLPFISFLLLSQNY